MATSSLDLYKDNSVHEVFTLASQNASGCTYLVSGRTLATPKTLSVTRKINASSKSNDTVSVKIAQTELNTTTGLPATFFVKIEISVPKDVSVITASVQKGVVAQLGSLINDGAALAATSVNRTALIEGRDL